MIYLYTFIISSFFLYLAEKNINKKNATIRCVYVCIAIIIPSLLAAIRNEYCGIDVTFYVTPIFEKANHCSNISSFFNDTSIEFGYGIYVYFITKLFGSLFYVHLFTQILIISPIVILLFILKKEFGVKISLAFFMYLLLCYNTSLCVIRQNLATSISILSIVFLLRKKYFFFLIVGFISCLFHNSNIIFILTTVLVYLVRYKISNYKYTFLLVFGILSIYTMYIFLLPYFSNVIGDIYMERMEENSNSNTGGYITLALRTILVFLPFFFIEKDLAKYNFILILPVFSLLFYLMGREIAYLGRLAIPYTVFIPVSIAVYLRNSKILMLFVLVLTLLLWYSSVILQGGYDTYPFTEDKYWNFR